MSRNAGRRGGGGGGGAGGGGTIPLASQSGEEPVTGRASSAFGTVNAAAHADHVHPVFMPVVADVGDYLDNGPMVNGGTTPTEAQEVAFLMWIPELMTIDRIGVMQGGDGSTGAVYRYVIRNFQPSNRHTPGSVLLDAGTIAAESLGGPPAFRIKTINQQLTPGFWWFSAICQGGATTRPQWMQVQAPVLVRLPSVSFAAGRTNIGYVMNSVTGAPNNTWTNNGSALDQVVPWFAIRRSA